MECVDGIRQTISVQVSYLLSTPIKLICIIISSVPILESLPFTSNVVSDKIDSEQCCGG